MSNSYNDLALQWSKKVRGLTVAEHAMIDILAAFHDKRMNTCRVQMSTLVWRFEVSRIYVREVLHTLKKKDFLEIEYRYKQKGLQDSNNFKLTLERFFPKGPDHDLGMKFLGHIQGECCSDKEMAEGIHEAWVERLPKRHKKGERNKLWIAARSREHYRALDLRRFTIERKIAEGKYGPTLASNYEIRILKTYTDRTTD